MSLDPLVSCETHSFLPVFELKSRRAPAPDRKGPDTQSGPFGQFAIKPEA